MNQTKLLEKLKEKHKVTFTRQYLGKLAREGKIPYEEIDGVKDYKLRAVVKALGELKQKSDKMPDGTKFDPVDKDGKVKTINSTKIMLQEYQAKIHKQKFDMQDGKLIDRDEVEQKAFVVIRVLRDQLLAMPERVTADIYSAKDIREAKEIFHKEMIQILNYLSDEKILYDH